MAVKKMLVAVDPGLGQGRVQGRRQVALGVGVEPARVVPGREHVHGRVDGVAGKGSRAVLGDPKRCAGW